MVSTVANFKTNQSWEEFKTVFLEKFPPVLMADPFESLLTLKHEQATAITQFHRLAREVKGLDK